MNRIPSLGMAYHLVVEDEQQRAVSAQKRPIVEATTFQTFTLGRKEMFIHLNLQRKKITPKDTKRESGEEIEHYSHCGRSENNREGCFKRIGYPDWWPGKEKQENKKTKVVCIDSTLIPISGLSNDQCHKLVKQFAKDGV